MGRKYNAEQKAGSEYSGNVRQNGTQPVDTWDELSTSDQYGLIKRTGQEGDPAATARLRNFLGQEGERKDDDAFIGDASGLPYYGNG
jgi:hypothetical protein